jgi:hypothetical protein
MGVGVSVKNKFVDKEELKQFTKIRNTYIK